MCKRYVLRYKADCECIIDARSKEEALDKFWEMTHGFDEMRDIEIVDVEDDDVV